MIQLEKESTLVDDRLCELAAWLRQRMRGTNRERQMSETFLDKLNAAIDAAGEAGLTGQQRTQLYELLLAANACDVAALRRLLVTANHDEREVLAGYRKLDPSGRSGVHKALRGMTAKDGKPGTKVFRAPVHQVADQIIVFDQRRDRGR